MRRFVGLVALFAWLAAACLWWLSQRAAPATTILRNVGGGAEQLFSSDGRLFVCGDDEHIRVYDVVDRVRLATWPRSMRGVCTVCGPVDGPALVLLQTADKAEVFDLITGATVATLSPGARTSSIWLAPNGKIAASVHNNKTVRLWDVGTGRALTSLTLPQASVGSANFSPDSMHLAIADYSGGPVRIIDVASGDVAACPHSISHGITMAVYARDGRLIGLATSAGDQSLWDLTNRKLLVTAPRASSGFLGGGSAWYVNHYPLSLLATIADLVGGTTASQALRDARRERQVFDTESGQMIACVPQAISGLFPDGKSLATYSFEEDSVQLWDVPSRTLVHPWVAWTALSLACALSACWWQQRRRGQACSAAASR